MDAQREGATEPELSADERAAIRAYLQRSEVRLSTVHRVASALLSGAGLMVLLPAVERDAVEGVLRALVTGPFDPAKALLTAATVMCLVVPFVALWLVLRDLAQFYFHANHVTHSGGEAFTPRFTLTGLLLPQDELGPTAAAALERERAAASAVAVLVPANDAARRNIDRRITAYGGLGVTQDGTDANRADALLELAASHSRTLLDEVAKVERGMARHVLRIQMIVLRYVKALLALLTTALAVFAAAAIVGTGGLALDTGSELWLAGVYLVWAPVVIVAVATPVRWLEKQLRSEGATHTAVADDHELTQVEDLTVRLALAGFAAAAAAMAVVLGRGDATPAEHWVGLAVLVGGVAIIATVLLRWSGGHLARRLGRHA